MTNVARINREAQEASRVVARVVARAPRGTWRLQGGDERAWDAQRAVGCLVEPIVGDLVEVLLHEAGRHIVCVLDREAGAAKTLAVDGDLAIEARGGSIAVAAHVDLDLVAARRAQVAAGEVAVTATQANLVIRRLTLLGDYVRAEIGKAKIFASTLAVQADRIMEHVRRSTRLVEESEHVRAGTLDYAARDLVNVRGGTTLVTAEALVKLDGEQVHLG